MSPGRNSKSFILFSSKAQCRLSLMLCVSCERLKATGNLEKSVPLQELVQELLIFPFREDSQGEWTTPQGEITPISDSAVLCRCSAVRFRANRSRRLVETT